MLKKILVNSLRLVYTCAVCHTVTTACRPKMARGQIIDIYKEPRCPTSYTTRIKIRSGSQYNLRLTSQSSAVASFILRIPMCVKFIFIFTNFPNFDLGKTFPILSDKHFFIFGGQKDQINLRNLSINLPKSAIKFALIFLINSVDIFLQFAKKFTTVYSKLRRNASTKFFQI